MTRKQWDWKNFLVNAEKKQQLIVMMQTCWSDLVKDRKVILIRNGEAHDIEDGRIKPELRSNQEETDSRVVLYCQYSAQYAYDYMLVRSPGSDTFWILLYHARSINLTTLFDTGHRYKKRLINIKQLSHHYSEDMCNALIGLRTFTGCDSASSFKGIGKIKSLKTLLKSPTHCEALKILSEQREVEARASPVLSMERQIYIRVVKVHYIMLKCKCDGDVTVDSLTLTLKRREFRIGNKTWSIGQRRVFRIRNNEIKTN